MAHWIVKANRIIAALCRESYLAANRLPNGKMRKRHVPYTIPESARALVDALNRDDEYEAKRLMLWDYDCQRVA